MNIIIEKTQAQIDADNEREITKAQLQLQFGKTPAARGAAWDRLQALIKRRSPQQIARMERERGLGP